MTAPSATPSPAPAAAGPVPPGRAAIWLAAGFVAWTLFVWVGRIRNALADPALDGGGRTGPILLSVAFVIPAAVLGVGVLADRGRPRPRWWSVLLLVTVLWTTGLWAVRMADIALVGDHEVGFVVVHAVLAVVSVGLGWAAVRADRRPSAAGG